MGKVRKAIAGGISGGLAAVGTGFAFTGAPTKEQIGNLVGLFAGGFFLGFVAVYMAKANEVSR
jgi:hypothetical protein